MKCSVTVSAIALFFYLIGFNPAVQAQIQPPDLLCIDNDTLLWETPVNTCGPFRGYIVMGSQSKAGPYLPIDTLTNPAQTVYFHELAGGNVWYYFMVSDFDCSGFSRLTSDTLDNRIPEIGPLQTVSVEGTHVVLSWAPSPSPETVGYIIARNTSAGTTIIDTVYGQTTYTDTKAAPHLQVETYFVTAIDRCGNTSLVDNPHSTMLLKGGEISECDQSISLNWTPYKGWKNGPEKYEVWVSANGAAPELDGSVDGRSIGYVFDQADDGVEYCFYIRAIEAGSGRNASSNEICQTAEVVQPIRELKVSNVIFHVNKTAVSWRWNANAQLTAAAIFRSVDNQPFEPIHNIDVTPPLKAENSYTDNSLPPGGGRPCYRIETTDACGDKVQSDAGCAIYLTAVSDGKGGNLISWTPFDIGQTTGLSYELFIVPENGVRISVATINGSETSFLHQTAPADNTAGTTCYEILAYADVLLADGTIEKIITRSNTACAEQSSAIYIPNAFAPTGVNTEFRAYLQFGDPTEFLLQVYDRWGNLVFQGNSIDQGWDGSKNGQDLPAGVYIYRLTLKQSNGKVIERSGSVALIR